MEDGQERKIRKLISLLLEEEPEYRQQAMRFSQDVESQRLLLRSLMNVRYPGKSLNPEYLCLQDELLAEEREEKGVVNVMELPPVSGKATEEDIKMDTYYASSNWHDTGGAANLKLQRWGGECRACQGDFPHGFVFLHNWLGFDMGVLYVWE